MVKRLALYNFFILLCFFSATVDAANISVFVDRQNISVNESFNLVFEADGSPDAEPDFSPLAVYFDILNQSQSSNMTIVNGNFSRKTVWTLVLLAKQAGTYAIPAIEFGSDRTKSLTIKIKKASAQQSAADKSIFLETELDHSSAFVQSQLIYTVRLYRSVDIQNASLTEPELSDADAIVEKIGEDKRYQTNRNGVRYIVIERQYAIFPQQSGQLSIKPVVFNGQIVSKRRSFFDIDSFNNPTRRIVSKQHDVTVKPVPDLFKNKHWLPSSEVKLVDEWPDGNKFKAGEPVTRTISLIAKGLTASQLPEITQREIANVKQYPDQPSLNNQKDSDGIIGIRQEKIAYIPTKAGKLTLPEINIPWWNTRSNKLEYARISSKTIHILPGTQTSTPVIAPAETAEATVNSQALVTPKPGTSAFWIYTTFFFLLCWLLTLFWFLKTSKTKKALVIAAPKKKTPVKDLSKKFASACHQNNPELCKAILLQWAQQQWPASSINTLGELARHVDGELREQITALNQMLYSNASSGWYADQLLTAFESNKGKPLNKNKETDLILEPINKLQ